jgi:acyl-CoA dehydrogenase
MDHSFTDERKQIVEAAREFAINEFSKLARECDREEKFPMEIWKKASELGLRGISISSKYADWGFDG